ncbi:right-handed parallel beta-helix repeat-containing protein [Rubrivivax rivuli]|nr:right-handed parallel beta-helix repeat-containing protein [Rubrivivax rivuli]
MVRHARRRLEGHPNLEAVALPVLARIEAHYIREPALPLRDLGKGVRPLGLTPQDYDTAGRPLPSLPAATLPARQARRVLLSTESLAEALRDARAGEVLELAPGTYRLRSRLDTGQAGQPGAPITLRAAQPGSVTLEVDTVQAVVAAQPYWVFENLVWRGVCASDDRCEHALHVVGGAVGVVLRNNRFEDFNAAIKVNGENGLWPDAGLLQFNTFSNQRARRTDKPVTPIDLVGASHWQVLDNHIERFIKLGGNGISFGVFLKGGGEGGRIERNLVVCTPEAVAQRGQRVGISLGGGGTDVGSCRRQPCDAEHVGGVVANNVVAHCNDSGIDVFRSPGASVAHNTLVNTLGVMVREAPAQARLQANVVEGRLQQRRGARLESLENLETGRLAALMAQPDALDLRWQEMPALASRPEGVTTDFCARPRATASPPGATQAARCEAP